ncbi:MAG: hypothetical protein ACHQPI_05575 [Thermoanaerobaculia bacterium]
MSPASARRFAALALLAAAPALLAEGDAPAPDPLPRVWISAIGSGFIPLQKGESTTGELWYAAAGADYSRETFGAKVELRGASGGFRPYYATPVWLQESTAFLTTPLGDARAGLTDRAFGLPDDTFSGTLFSDNGVTRSPFWGAGLSGETRVGYDSLTWAARWDGVGARAGSWEETGRGAASDPSASRLEGASARVGYLFYKGLLTLKPGLSGETIRVAFDGRPSFRLNDLAVELTLTAGPLALMGQLFLRGGERQSAGSTLDLAYDSARAGLVEFRAEFPTVVYRIVWSEWSYLGAETREWLLQPAVVWMPRKGIEATIEYLARRLVGPSGTVSGDAFRLGFGLRF